MSVKHPNNRATHKPDTPSVTRTVRIEKDLDDLIQTLANHERMSVNALVNKSLRNLADWDRFADFFGMMTFTPMLVEGLVERLSVEEAVALGRKNADELAEPMIMLMLGEFDTVHALEALRRFGSGTRSFRFDDRVDGKRHVMVVRHAKGRKWSAFFEGMLIGIFQDGLGIRLSVSTKSDSSAASFTA